VPLRKALVLPVPLRKALVLRPVSRLRTVLVLHPVPRRKVSDRHLVGPSQALVLRPVSPASEHRLRLTGRHRELIPLLQRPHRISP